MNTQAQVSTTHTNTNTNTNTENRQQPAQLAKTGTRRTRFAASLASVLVSATLLATVVGGFGSQADSAMALAQAQQALVVAKA